MRAPDPAAPVEREESLAESFGLVARQLRAATLRSLAEYDVTPSQVRALRVLGHHGEMRPSALATDLRITPRSATEVVDDLVDKGLVRRAPDPDDRRATLVALTAHGEELRSRLRAARGEQSELVLGRLSAVDRDHLARILHVLRRD